MQRPIYYLNGKGIRSIHTLGKALRATFFFEEHLDLTSLDVINDVLYGGYGTLNSGESYTVVWQHYKTSERLLDPDLLEAILAIFEGLERVTLVLE